MPRIANQIHNQVIFALAAATDTEQIRQWLRLACDIGALVSEGLLEPLRHDEPDRADVGAFARGTQYHLTEKRP